MEYPRKVDYQEYENSFNYDLLKKLEEGQVQSFDTETMRGLIYGFTFSEDYKNGIIPDAFSLEYWAEKYEERFKANLDIGEGITDGFWVWPGILIVDAIESTGKGTADMPFCVICVGQEYEFLSYYRPTMSVVGQRLLSGHIDCLELVEEGSGYSETIYFDISRWFERFKS